MGKRNDSLHTGAIRALKTAAGSYKTRHNHLREVQRFVGTLRQTGYGVQKWENLTNRHVAAVVNQWQSDGLAVSTIKEYLSGVRAVTRHFDNARIAPDNRAFGIENRVYVTNTDKSVPKAAYEKAITTLKNSPNINDNRVAAQLMLQRTLGLRKEESFKFNPSRAVLADGRVHISDGTKGGRERIVQHPTSQARTATAYAKAVLSGSNTMTSGMSERQWNNRFYRTIRENGITKEGCGASSHGLRHAFAHERYQALTGFAVSVKFASREAFRANAQRVAGSDWQKLDQDARTLLKAELGHGPDRDDVVSVYIGRS